MKQLHCRGSGWWKFADLSEFTMSTICKSKGKKLYISTVLWLIKLFSMGVQVLYYYAHTLEWINQVNVWNMVGAGVLTLELELTDKRGGRLE